MSPLLKPIEPLTSSTLSLSHLQTNKTEPESEANTDNAEDNESSPEGKGMSVGVACSSAAEEMEAKKYQTSPSRSIVGRSGLRERRRERDIPQEMDP